LNEAEQISLTYQQVSDARVSGDRAAAIQALLSGGAKVVIEKRGREGARAHLEDGSSVDAAGYPVTVQNILGAGDAFAAGFIYGQLQGWSWRKSMRMGNACGAIVVTRHGCANFMPTLAEALDFATSRGGL